MKKAVAKIGDEGKSFTIFTLVDALTRQIGRGERTQGLLDAVEECGHVLAEHFPPGSIDKNELPNHLIVLDVR